MKTRFIFSAFNFFATLLFFTFLTTSARAQMSETERKAAARAAYQEGVKLQDDGKFADALSRFEAAEKLFDAPTHLLHIAECQGLTGRLVEASETYETLARKTLPAGSPEAFTQAQQQGQAELPALRARIPSLRVTTKPGPQQVQNLQVNVNGVNMPIELLGIARPLNPGTYRFSAQAAGWSTAQSIDVPLAEKEQKSVELTLQQGAGGGVVVAPPPPPYGGKEKEKEREKDKDEKPKRPGPTSAGLLLGVHAGAEIPGGDVNDQVKLENFATTGGSGGIDLYARLARMLLLGFTFDYAALGTPKQVNGLAANQTADTSASATYVGINIGIIPNVDKVSFIGDLGIGSRTATLNTTVNGVSADTSATGVEFTISAGISIPAGPIRIVPKTSIGVGSFTSVSTNGKDTDIDSNSRSSHVFVFLGVAAFYSLDFGQKVQPVD
jgi:hypothetical protein